VEEEIQEEFPKLLVEGMVAKEEALVGVVVVVVEAKEAVELAITEETNEIILMPGS